MSYWVEVRCDMHVDDAHCLSAKNIGPMEMVGFSLDRAGKGISKLAKQAKKEGWKLTREGWACPACQPQEPSSPSTGKPADWPADAHWPIRL